MQYRPVATAEPDIGRTAPLRVRRSLDGIGALASSISEHGVLDPPLLADTGEHLDVVSGFRRLSAAREAGLREVHSLIIDVRESGIYRAVPRWLESLAHGAALDEADLVILASRVEAVAGERLPEHMPALTRLFGRKMTPGEVGRISRLASLGERVLEALSDGAVSYGDLLRLDRHPGIDTGRAAMLLAESGMSRSARRPVVRDLLSLASSGEGEFDRFAREYDASRSLADQVAERVRPTMMEDMRTLENIVNGMGLPPRASIRLPENLEGGSMTAEIRVRRPEDLRLAIERLGEALEDGRVERILGILRGKDWRGGKQTG